MCPNFHLSPSPFSTSNNRAAAPVAHAVFLFDEEADEAEGEAEDEQREEDDPAGRADAAAYDGQLRRAAVGTAEVPCDERLRAGLVRCRR